MFRKIHPCFSILSFLAGKKLIIITLVFFLLPTEVIISQLADSPWPMYQCDSKHTGKSKYAGIRKPNLAWSYKICDDSWVVGDIVVGTDGTIYIPVSNGTGMGAQEGFLYAINPNGTFKWKYQFEGICVPAVTVPAIASDGTIYVHVNGNANIAAQERIYAINPDSTKKWEYLEEVAAFVGADISSPVVANDGSITYCSKNTASTRISSDGEYIADLLDNYYNSIHTSPALISGDTIYISEDGGVKAYRSSGELIWANYLPGASSSGFQGSPSIDINGTIYISNPNTLYALSFDDSIKWMYTLNTESPIYSHYYATPAISSYGPIVSTGSGLFAVNNDGSFRWKISKSDTRCRRICPTIGKDDIIYWQSQDSLFIINDGIVIGKYGFPNSGVAPRQSAIIMPDSTILCINGVYLLAIKNIPFTVVEQVVSEKSITYYLSQNYPNPFNPSTKITFALPKPEHVTLCVYSTLGQKVAILLDTKMNAGSHSVQFDASGLPSGIYFYRIQTDQISQTKKMVFLK